MNPEFSNSDPSNPGAPNKAAIASHMWVGKRQWGINPSADKPCVVCNVPRGQHKSVVECKAFVNDVKCDLGFPHYPQAHENSEHNMVWASHAETQQMEQDGLW